MPKSNLTDQEVRDIFHKHLEIWHKETCLSSRIIIEHPSYLRIIGLGPAVLPHLFAEMQVRPGWYFTILRSIVDDNPKDITNDDAGRLQSLTDKWLKWADENGYT